MYTVLIKPTHGLAEPATRSGKTASRCQTFLLPMVWLVYALFLLSLVFSVREAHPQTGVVPPIASRTVLILSGLTSNDPSVKLLVPALYETLIAGGVREHNIYIEYLDLYRFPSPRVAEEKKALLMAKYAETHLDLLIPISQAAVDFVARELEHLYLEVPMLVPFITAEPEWKGIRRPMISLPPPRDIEGTLDLALTLFPDTKKLLILSGSDKHSREFLQVFRDIARKYPEFNDIWDTADLALPDLLDQVSVLPEHSIVVFGSFFNDGMGKAFTPEEVAGMVAAHSPVPVFGLWTTHLAQGLFGGSVFDIAGLGRQAGYKALEYFYGRLQAEGLVGYSSERPYPLFSWPQLGRFKVDHLKLPSTTVYLGRPLGLWYTHRAELLTITVSFVVLCCFTLLLASLNRKLWLGKKTLEQALETLQTTSGLMTMSQKISHTGSWRLDLPSGEVRWSDEAYRIYGYQPQEFTPGRDASWREAHPDDRTAVKLAYTDSLQDMNKIHDFEYRIIRKNTAEVRAIHERWFHECDESGARIHTNGVFQDITERKQAEQVLETQLREKEALIKEKETLIKELFHRTFNNMQVIQALLSYRMSAHPDLPLDQFVDDITVQIRSMAMVHQELYQAKHLSRIDICAYLRKLVETTCDQVHAQHPVVLSFDLEPVDILLDSAIPLGLIVIELVGNCLRHAFTTEGREAAPAELRVYSHVSETGVIEVGVSDNGIGWAPEEGSTALESGGLGLASLLVTGQLGGTISFSKNCGTRCVIRFEDNHYSERVQL